MLQLASEFQEGLLFCFWRFLIFWNTFLIGLVTKMPEPINAKTSTESVVLWKPTVPSKLNTALSFWIIDPCSGQMIEIIFIISKTLFHLQGKHSSWNKWIFSYHFVILFINCSVMKIIMPCYQTHLRSTAPSSGVYCSGCFLHILHISLQSCRYFTNKQNKVGEATHTIK